MQNLHGSIATLVYNILSSYFGYSVMEEVCRMWGSIELPGGLCKI